MKNYIANTQKKILLFCMVFIANVTLGQSLDSLLQLVVNNNPTLKSLQLEYEAEAQRTDQVSQLPNLELGAGIPILRPETRLGGQVVILSATQMFPWFGTLKSKENVVISMSKAKYEMVSATKLELFARVKVAYYQLYFLNNKKEIISNYLNIYHTIESVTLSKVESGQSTTADVFRIQLKIQEFENELMMIENEIIFRSAEINELANLPWNNKIIPSDELSDVASMNFDIEEFKTKIENNHPLIKQLDNKIEASKNEQLNNKNINRPSFGLGVDYSYVEARTDADPTNNGRDIFIPKVKISIPIYRKSYNAKNREEDFLQQSYTLQKEGLTNKMLTLLQREKTNYDNALLEYQLFQKQMETTQRTYEILLSQYSSTGKGFDELLQIQNQLLNYELQLSLAQVNTFIAKANVDKLTDF